MSRSIFIIKPIIDLLYDEAKLQREEIDALKKQLVELKKENSELYAENRKLEERMERAADIQLAEQFNDDIYAEAAMAPPSAPPAASRATVVPIVLTQVEKVENKVIIPTTDQEGSRVINLKEKKKPVNRSEYNREYQRAYRKKQKDIEINL